MEWRPINLQSGDIEEKEKVMEAWRELQMLRTPALDTSNWVLPASPHSGLKDTRKRQRRSAESQAGRKSRLDLAAGRVVMWDREDSIAMDKKASEMVSARRAVGMASLFELSLSQ